MSRKKKRAKRRDTKTKVAFIKSICNKQCNLCSIVPKDFAGSNKEDMLFCYDFVYSYQPKIFLNNILPNLKTLALWEYDVDEEVSTKECEEFAKLFCDKVNCESKDMDAGVCSNIEFCLATFRDYVISCVYDNGHDDEEETTSFMSGAWDGTGAHWGKESSDWGDPVGKVAGALGSKGCKKRGKKKAQNKKLSAKDKKKNRRAKQKAANANAYDDSYYDEMYKERKVTVITNMSPEQLAFIYGEDENNDKKQTEAGTGSG